MDPLSFMRPLFIVRIVELILGVVCFLLVTKYFAEDAAASAGGDPLDFGHLRYLALKRHLVSVSAFAFPFLAASTLATHLVEGHVVERHFQPMLLAAAGFVCNFLAGIYVLIHADDNGWVVVDVYDSSSYYFTGVFLIFTGIAYVLDIVMAIRNRNH